MIHAAEARIKRLAALSRTTEDTDLLELLKVQALREFLLLTSSDWPFLITEKQAEDYGAKRFRNMRKGSIDSWIMPKPCWMKRNLRCQRMKSSATSRMSARLIIHSPTSRFSVLGRQNHEGLEKRKFGKTDCGERKGGRL